MFSVLLLPSYKAGMAFQRHKTCEGTRRTFSIVVEVAQGTQTLTDLCCCLLACWVRLAHVPVLEWSDW